MRQIKKYSVPIMYQVFYRWGNWDLESWSLAKVTVVLEKTLENPLDSKEIKPVNPKGNQPWIFFGRMDAEAETLWPKYFGHLIWGADSLEKTLMLGKIEAGGEGGGRGWDGWMASPTQWTWVWANSGSWWGQGSLVLQSMELQRVGQHLMTEQQHHQDGQSWDCD